MLPMVDVALTVPQLMVDTLEDSGTSRFERRQMHTTFVMARRAPGVTIERAIAAVDGLVARQRQEPTFTSFLLARAVDRPQGDRRTPVAGRDARQTGGDVPVAALRPLARTLDLRDPGGGDASLGAAIRDAVPPRIRCNRSSRSTAPPTRCGIGWSRRRSLSTSPARSRSPRCCWLPSVSTVSSPIPSTNARARGIRVALGTLRVRPMEVLRAD